LRLSHIKNKTFSYVSTSNKITTFLVNESEVVSHGGSEKGQPDWSRTAYISNLKSSFPMVMNAVMRFSYEFR
jgi:hypothetical protein